MTDSPMTDPEQETPTDVAHRGVLGALRLRLGLRVRLPVRRPVPVRRLLRLTRTRTAVRVDPYAYPYRCERAAPARALLRAGAARAYGLRGPGSVGPGQDPCQCVRSAAPRAASTTAAGTASGSAWSGRASAGTGAGSGSTSTAVCSSRGRLRISNQ